MTGQLIFGSVLTWHSYRPCSWPGCRPPAEKKQHRDNGLKKREEKREKENINIWFDGTTINEMNFKKSLQIMSITCFTDPIVDGVQSDGLLITKWRVVKPLPKTLTESLVWASAICSSQSVSVSSADAVIRLSLVWLTPPDAKIAKSDCRTHETWK